MAMVESAGKDAAAHDTVRSSNASRSLPSTRSRRSRGEPMSLVSSCVAVSFFGHYDCLFIYLFMIGDSFFFSLDLFIFFTPPFPLFPCHLPVGDGPHTGSMAPSSFIHPASSQSRQNRYRALDRARRPPLPPKSARQQRTAQCV